MGRNKTGYGTNPMSNDLIVVVDFDKTILAIIPVIVEGNITRTTWNVAALPAPCCSVPSGLLERQWIGLRQVNVHGSAGAA